MKFIGTKNFTLASDPKLTCQCGCGMLPEQDFMERVQRVRDNVGRPMRVASGARCPAHNEAVSTTGRTGPHTTGRAIDIECYGGDALDVMYWMIQAGFTGIGVSQKGENGKRFIHGDDLPNATGRSRPWIWSY